MSLTRKIFGVIAMTLFALAPTIVTYWLAITTFNDNCPSTNQYYKGIACLILGIVANNLSILYLTRALYIFWNNEPKCTKKEQMILKTIA